MTTRFEILKHAAPMVISCCHFGGRLFFVCVVFVVAGCAAQENSSDEPSQAVIPPTAIATTESDEDTIAPLFTADAASATSRSGNSRAQASSAATKDAADKTGGETTPETDAAHKKDAAPEKDQAVRSEKDAVTDPTDNQSQQRTSMPNRGQKEKKSSTVGGVRKALPVNRAAAALFGKWKVDQSNSTPGFVRADSILFIADGRMRIWRNAAAEDGRWTWTKSDGVKTGGLDNFPLALGLFEQENGVMTISVDGERKVALTPDRLFVAPPPFLPAPKAP